MVPAWAETCWSSFYIFDVFLITLNLYNWAEQLDKKVFEKRLMYKCALKTCSRQANRRTRSLRFLQGWFVSLLKETKRSWERTVTVSSSSQSSPNTDELYTRSCICYTVITLACGTVCERQAWRTLMDAADCRSVGHSTQDSGTDNHVFCITAV